APRAEDAHAVLLHGGEVPSPCDQDDIAAAPRECCADIGADRACTDDRELHRSASSSSAATRLRWSLPVAVRGIRSTILIVFGTLNWASRSRQCRRSSASSAAPPRTTAA